MIHGAGTLEDRLITDKTPFVDEINKNTGKDVEVVLGGELQKREEVGTSVEKSAPLPAKNDFLTAFQQRLCLDTYPVPASHMIEDTPVVPFALMAEWFAHGVEYTSHGLYFSGLDDMRLL